MKLRQKQKMDDLKNKFQAQNQPNIPRDPVEFFEQILHITPYPYQATWLRDPAFLKVNRWCRRAGKTTTFSGDDIHFSAINPRSTTLVLMPKHDQTKEVYFQGEGGLHEHLARMDRNIYHNLIDQQLETIIRFRNGSKILAEVPEPFTIRGHGPHKISLDEMNFIRKDRDLWLSALLPMTLTRPVRISVASTPWNKDSIYWKMCFDAGFKFFSGNVHEKCPEKRCELAIAKHPTPSYFLTWKDVMKPNGPLDEKQVEMMKEQYGGDMWRWQREMESSFVDDETAFLPSSLIIKCQSDQLEYFEFEQDQRGSFFIGWDLGRERDPGDIAVLKKHADILSLIHKKKFPLGTPYVSQMGYIKAICDRWQNVEAVYYDHTGTLGMDEEIKQVGFPGVQGINFTEPNKHGMATYFKNRMMTVRESDRKMAPEEAKRQFEFPHDMELEAELNVVQWEQKPGSQIYSFSHQQGTHDDTFWAIALACLASTGATPDPILEVLKFG
jgi:phage FluMu gp28-like protein